MRGFILFLLLAVSCAPREEQAGNNKAREQNAAAAAPVDNALTTPAVPTFDRRSPEAAVEVLREYFAAIADRRYADAYRSWSDGGRASGMSLGEFAASFDKFRSYQGTVGEPGAMEGATGSSYIDIPVDIGGRLTGGSPFEQKGELTLRRANDVPGATPEQLQWRIFKADLSPDLPDRSYRFVGRWATEERNCTPRAWVFSASSLRTPAASVCSFSKVSEVPGGYDIAASCMAEGPARDDTLRLRFAESARALLFESRTIADAGLVRCR